MPRARILLRPHFLNLLFYLLPFQIKKLGIRNPGYPQIPKRFFTKTRFASKIRNRAPPHEKNNCFLTGAVAVEYDSGGGDILTIVNFQEYARKKIDNYSGFCITVVDGSEGLWFRCPAPFIAQEV